MQIIHYIQQPSRREHLTIAVVVQGQVDEGAHPMEQIAYVTPLAGVDVDSTLIQIVELAKLSTFGTDNLYPGAIIHLIGKITLEQFREIFARSDRTIQSSLPTQFPDLFSA